MDIHVGMMLKFLLSNLLGWIVDDTVYNHRGVICNKVEWANGSICYEAVENIKLYRQRWLELEEAHERLSNKD